MTSNLKRAQGKEMAQPPQERSLLARGSWKSILVLAVLTLVSVVSAHANDSVLIGHQGLNQPRGMVRVNVPDLVNGGIVSDYWVTDSIAGFCRLSATGVLELGTCDVNGTFEMNDYQVETFGVNGTNGYVFVAGVDGVRRFNFIIVGGRTAIDTANVQVFAGAGSVFTNGVAISGRNLPSTTNLGPDGKLYMGFVGNTDIWRVLNPLSPTFTPLGNEIERVGVAEGTGGRAVSMAWIGHDLWLEDVGFINMIPNADSCAYLFPQCSATIQFRNLFAHAGMTSDQFMSTVPNGHYLYWANGSRVMRYDTTTAGLMQVWNQQGTNTAGVLEHYTLILALNFLQTATPTQLADGSFVEDMTIATDPVVDALFPAAALIPPRVGAGRTWLLAASAGMVPEVQCDALSTSSFILNPPPCALSAIGTPGVDPAPNPLASRRAILLASGITHPRGLLWLNSNWWVSDEQFGFCRIDINPLTGTGSLTNCFQADPTFVPGQTAASAPDPTTGEQVVYVPDASGATSSIYRFLFTPDATGGALVLNGILDGTGSRRGTWIQTVALPTGPFNDGALYIGYADSGVVEKITDPAVAPAAPLEVARTFNGIGVISMAFNGNDLYLSEMGPPPIAGQFIKKGQVTEITKASPSVSAGRAEPVKRAIARLQTPQIIVENPGGFTVGPTGDRPVCLPPPGVKLSASVPPDPATTPAFYIGTLGMTADGVFNPGVSNGLAERPEVDQYDFICNIQQVWVTDGAIDPVLTTNLPLGPVTSMGFSGTDAFAVLAIGDDPSVIVPLQQRERGQIRKVGPPGTGSVGQGHVYIVP